MSFSPILFSKWKYFIEFVETLADCCATSVLDEIYYILTNDCCTLLAPLKVANSFKETSWSQWAWIKILIMLIISLHRLNYNTVILFMNYFQIIRRRNLYHINNNLKTNFLFILVYFVSTPFFYLSSDCVLEMTTSGATLLNMIGEKPKKFNRSDFKRW